MAVLLHMTDGTKVRNEEFKDVGDFLHHMNEVGMQANPRGSIWVKCEGVTVAYRYIVKVETLRE